MTSPATSPNIAAESDGEKDGKGRIQILSKRATNTPASLSEKIRSPTDFLRKPQTPPVPSNNVDPRHPDDSLRSSFEDQGGTAKEKRKGVSFLSRLRVSKKKDIPSYSPNPAAVGSKPDLINENGSESSDLRPEGMDAPLFSHSVDNIRFNPRHPPPPEYIKVHLKQKRTKEFDRVFLAQQLRASLSGRRGSTNDSSGSQKSAGVSDPDAIWTLKFSKDGKYLAAGGQDKVIRLWAVLNSPEERRNFEKAENAQGARTRLNAPVFQDRTSREFKGHDGPVIDLDWSKNNFLLSSSYDKTVRLWHISRPECLCTFKHTEHVLAARFHPRDDRFFLAGCRDMKLRFWSIPDKTVAFSSQLPDVITAVAFTPDGTTAIAGTCGGLCYVFETEGLKFQSQIHVKSSHGKNAKGSKICSIETISSSTATAPEQKGAGINFGGKVANVKILISSADSRIRLYNLRDKSLESKFKGHKAEELPIQAYMSDDGRYIVSGSEDRAAYIWPTEPPESDSKHRPVEYFDVSRDKATAVLLAPTKTKQLLAKSEDPIYDLCNPPPVTLVSRSASLNSSRPPTESGSVQNTPTQPSPSKKPAENPAYVARNSHPDGHIIVAASTGGAIKVFRQDCASTKRRVTDAWETGSLFPTSKRPSSVYMARALGPSRNRRSDSTSTQPPQDRILLWRQGIGSSTSLDRGSLRQGSDMLARQGSDARGLSTTRSASPRRPVDLVSTRSSSRHHDPSIAPPSASVMPDVTLTESPTKIKRPEEGMENSVGPTRHGGTPLLARNSSYPSGEGVSQKSADINPLMLHGGKSFMFWDPKRYMQSSAPAPQDPEMLSVNDGAAVLSQKQSKMSISSAVSKLSSEEEPSVAGEEMLCTECGGQEFQTKTVKGAARLVCQRCGTLAEM